MQTDANAPQTFNQSALRFAFPANQELRAGLQHPRNFGIARVKAPDSGCRFQKVRIVATVDQSGSMSDHCPDGKSKMQHVHHTLRNIVDYIVSDMKDVSATISIIGFDDKINMIEKETPITQELSDRMDDVLKKLRPRGMTNIHGALLKAREVITSVEQDESVQTIHILLTDGQITVGTSDFESLRSACTDVATNAFIGYGTDHNSYILKGLSEVPRGSYYFVESLENAGMAYGEILYQSIFELFRNVVIETTDCEVYDYKTNSWTHKLNVEALAAKQERTWHVRHDAEPSDDDDDTPRPVVAMRFIRTGGSQEEIVNAVLPPPQYPQPGGRDLEVVKYLWRQRTQEFMAMVREEKKPNSPTQAGWDGVTLQPPPAFVHPATLAPPVPRIPSILPKPPVLQRQQPPTKAIQDEHMVLDLAKAGHWDAVWAMLRNDVTKTNCMPHPRRFTLLHHAIHQGLTSAVEKLIELGADVHQLTMDGLTPTQLIDAASYAPETKAAIRTLLEDDTEEQEPLSKALPKFLDEMKEFMRANDLLEDKFMQTLCDDIYVAIRSMTSTLGDMYLNARVSSQGVQRAYNVRDVTALEQSQRTPPTSAGGRTSPLGRPPLQHEMSQDVTTPYAEPSVGAMMRAVSGPARPSRTPDSQDADPNATS